MGDIIKMKNETKTNLNVRVYKIQYLKCNNMYIGETSFGLKTRIQERRLALSEEQFH